MIVTLSVCFINIQLASQENSPSRHPTTSIISQILRDQSQQLVSDNISGILGLNLSEKFIKCVQTFCFDLYVRYVAVKY